MWWVAVLARAQEASVGGPEFDAIVQELLPIVADAVGRPPGPPIRTGVVTRARLAELLEIPPPRLGPAPPWDAPEAPRAALATYVESVRGVFLVKERMEALFEQTGLDPSALRPLVRCIAAHEVVHVLVDRYADGSVRGGPAYVAGRRALNEGYATLVGDEVCDRVEGPDVARVARSVQGSAAPGTVAVDAFTARYVFGRALVKALRADDPELVWAALSGPAPSMVEVASDVRPAIAGGWTNTSAVERLREALGGSSTYGPLVAAPAASFLGPLLGIADPDDRDAVRAVETIPAAPAAWTYVSRTVSLGAFSYDPAAAVELIRARRRIVRYPGDLRYHGLQPAPNGPVLVDARRRHRLAPHGLSLWVAYQRVNGAGPVVGGTDRSVEAWVADGTVLVVASFWAADSRRAVDALRAAVADLALLSRPTDRVTFDRLSGWVDAARRRIASLVATTSPEWRLGDAAWAKRNGETAPCLAAFADAVGEEPSEDAGVEWREAAYKCAVLTGDLGYAAHVAIGLEALPVMPALQHAKELVDAGRPADALAVIDRVTPTEGNAEALFHARVVILGKLGRWDEVAAAGRSAGSPRMAADAAEVLWKGGHHETEAREILETACQQQQGSPEACGLLGPPQ